MALETHKYTTITREVVAVRVTSQNMREVAAWCDGEITNNKPDGQKGPRHIRVNVPNARDDRQRRAYPGDWVVQNEKGFRIFMNQPFLQNFVQIDGVDSVLQETGVPAKQAAKKKPPKKSAPKHRPRPINPVMAAAMKSAQEKLGATEITQGPHGAIVETETTVTKQTPVKVIEGAELHSISVVMDPPHPEWKIETMDAVSKHPNQDLMLEEGTPEFDAVAIAAVEEGEEVRTVQNSLDRITGMPATVYTPPEDLVSPDAEINTEGALMEKANERQDPADAKKVDAAVETTPQDPPAEPAPSNPTTNTPDEGIVVEPETPPAG